MRRSRVVGAVVGVVAVTGFGFVIHDVSHTKLCGAHCEADQVVVTFTPDTTRSQADAVRAACAPATLAFASPISANHPFVMVVSLRYSANDSREHTVFSCLHGDRHVATAAIPL